MTDIYTSEDGDAVVDLQAYSAGYEKRIAELEQENERLRKEKEILHINLRLREIDGSMDEHELIMDAERWRTHSPLWIQLIKELVDEADDFGTIGEGAKKRVKSFIDEAMK